MPELALHQVNLVVRDLDASVRFYRRLGIDVGEPAGPHASAVLPNGLLLDLDQIEFARQWNSGSPEVAGGSAVLNLSVASRARVDELWQQLVDAGYTGRQAPYDAFWGSRFAVLADPDGYQIGLMSPREDAHRFWPPTQAPGAAGPQQSAAAPVRVRIVQLAASAIDALAAGDLERARFSSGLPLPASFLDPDGNRVWRRRSSQVAEHPDHAGWVTGVVLDVVRDRVVGAAGFHGPPDERGMVEIGYGIASAERRRGYARAALDFLLDRAAREPDVRVVRLTISPENAPSLGVIEPYGFAHVGEQWDTEDGLELIFERPAD